MVPPQKVLSRDRAATSRQPHQPLLPVAPPQAPSYEKTGYLFDQLCSFSEGDDTSSLLRTCTTEVMRVGEHTRMAFHLEHYIFDGHWVARPSKPHPMLTMRMQPLPHEHTLFHAPPPPCHSPQSTNLLLCSWWLTQVARTPSFL